MTQPSRRLTANGPTRFALTLIACCASLAVGPLAACGGGEPAPETLTPMVIVIDQTLAFSNEVSVDTVASTADGWIVIHEDAAGAPGAVIGFGAVDAGTTEALRVTLQRDAQDGETLYAMLHADAGVLGTYEGVAIDPPVLDDAGAVIAPSFVVLGGGADPRITPFVTVFDQAVDPPTEVVVAEAMSDGPGWVVILADDGAGQPGARIGQAPLYDGSNLDVVVTVTPEVAAGDTLYARLHTDDGQAGVFEFDEAVAAGDPVAEDASLDAPVLDADGAPIAPDFQVLP